MNGAIAKILENCDARPIRPGSVADGLFSCGDCPGGASRPVATHYCQEHSLALCEVHAKRHNEHARNWLASDRTRP